MLLTGAIVLFLHMSFVSHMKLRIVFLTVIYGSSLETLLKKGLNPTAKNGAMTAPKALVILAEGAEEMEVII